MILEKVKENTDKILVEILKSWRADPALFVEEGLGVGRCKCGCKIDDQIRVLYRDIGLLRMSKAKRGVGLELTEEEARYVDKTGLSVKSGKGAGKTAFLSHVLIWHVVCCGPDVKDMVTAPRKDALRDNLFSEIAKWLKHGEDTYGDSWLLKDWLAIDSLKLYNKKTLTQESIGKQLVVYGRTCSRNADEATQKATLQGYHSWDQILAADESYGVMNPVFDPLESTMTMPANFMILIGNPTKNNGYAYETFTKNAKYWVTRTINTEKSSLVSKEFIEKMKEKYRDYPNLYRVNILGEHPLDEEGALIPYSKIMDGVDRYKELDESVYKDVPIVFGCDIGIGGDLSVIAMRQGAKVEIIGTSNQRETQEIARWIGGYIEKYGPIKVGIDAIGVGKGVYDHLKYTLGYDNVVFVDARSTSSDKSRFKNLRAELYYKLADAFITSQIAIEDNEDLIKELSILQLNPSSDKYQIMSKLDMKRKGIESPNIADSVMITYYFSDHKMIDLKAKVQDRYKEDVRSYESSWMAA